MELVNVVRSRQDGFLHSNLFTEQSCLIHNTFSPYNHHFSKWSNWRWAKKNCINFEEEKSYLGQLERGECKRKVGDGEGSICLYSNLLCTCLAPQSPAPFSLSLSVGLSLKEINLKLEFCKYEEQSDTDTVSWKFRLYSLVLNNCSYEGERQQFTCLLLCTVKCFFLSL